MRRNIRVLLVLLGMSVSTVVFGSTISLAQKVENNQMRCGADEEDARLYRTLSSLPMRDRKTILNDLTPEAKSRLWKVHLRSYLSKHPELTEKQREAIQSVIALITPRLFEIPPDTPEFETEVVEQGQRLRKKFLELFPPKVVHELLEKLGGPEPPKESDRNDLQVPKGTRSFQPSRRKNSASPQIIN